MSDREWLIPVSLIVAGEAAAWSAAYAAGIAGRPLFLTYGALELLLFGLLLLTVTLWRTVAVSSGRSFRSAFVMSLPEKRGMAAIFIGLALTAIGAAIFSSLKASFPAFWLDPALAKAEATLLGTGGSTLVKAAPVLPFFDRLYCTFVPGHTIAVMAVLLLKPSPLKTRALVSLALAWLLIGLVGGSLLSSAGPIFFDRVYGGSSFAGLTDALQRGAPLTTLTANMLWRAHESGSLMVGNGISAMPSMHVALTLWLALLLNRTRFAAFGWVYFALIWVGSVLLGWHWFSDGLVGSLAMLGLWYAAPRFAQLAALNDVASRTRVANSV